MLRPWSREAVMGRSGEVSFCARALQASLRAWLSLLLRARMVQSEARPSGVVRAAAWGRAVSEGPVMHSHVSSPSAMSIHLRSCSGFHGAGVRAIVRFQPAAVSSANVRISSPSRSSAVT